MELSQQKKIDIYYLVQDWVTNSFLGRLNDKCIGGVLSFFEVGKIEFT